MAFITANGKNVLDGTRITIPRTGLWHADLAVDAPDGLSGACTLAIEGGLTLVGTAARAGVWIDTAHVRLLPGAAGLGKLAKAKHYRNVSLSVVLRDLLATAGEKVAASSDASVLAAHLPMWTQAQQEVGAAITALVSDRRRPDAVWRALPDGTIWVGKETWPDSGLQTPRDYQELDEAPQEGRAELGIEAPQVLPGQLLGGRRVSGVEYRLDGGALRKSVWFED